MGHAHVRSPLYIFVTASNLGTVLLNLLSHWPLLKNLHAKTTLAVLVVKGRNIKVMGVTVRLGQDEPLKLKKGHQIKQEQTLVLRESKMKQKRSK